MKKKSPKKLSLNRESLGMLTGNKLALAVGGSFEGPTRCDSCTCAASCIGTCQTCPPCAPPPVEPIPSIEAMAAC